MIEEWRDIKGYKGLYEVSNTGLVRNSRTLKEVKPYVTRQGYKRLALWRCNQSKKYFVHKLVAEAFVPNPDSKDQVNHIDENKLNNNCSNLEWCTQRENHNHGTINKRISKALINNPKKSKPVEALDDFGNVVFSFSSIYEAERQTGINNCTIRDCIHHRRRVTKAGGYKWRLQ